MFLVARLHKTQPGNDADLTVAMDDDVHRAGVTKGRSSMSTFDDPFDGDRKLGSGCVCGRHGSAAEHEQAELALRCEPAESDEKRYESVVASAVMRAMFPKDAARRAFLKSVGASTALAALSQFFPSRPRPKSSRRAARSRRRISRSGSSQSPAPR